MLKILTRAFFGHRHFCAHLKRLWQSERMEWLKMHMQIFPWAATVRLINLYHLRSCAQEENISVRLSGLCPVLQLNTQKSMENNKPCSER